MGAANAETNGDIAYGDTDGWGDIQTDYPIHSFIPMVSSLALSSSDYTEIHLSKKTALPIILL